MRITTKMLNQSAMQAGMPIHGSSLLNYVKDGKTNNNLLAALNKRNAVGENRVNQTNYEKLEKAADSTGSAAAALFSGEKDSLFAKAKESGDYSEVYRQINSLADSYNDTLKNLARMPGALNTFYKDSLTEAVSKGQELLEKVGFTVAKDGTLSVNQEKLKGADKEALQKAFGEEAGPAAKIQFVASHIAKGAQANLESAATRYSAAGSTYFPSRGSYDFRS